MILEILAASVALVLISASVSRAASIIVAASNSSAESKNRADFICGGNNDQVHLLASITRANRFSTKVDTAPAVQKSVECYGRHSVEWLPGDYYLGETLTIPDAADVAIQAEGAYFHYLPAEGDAVVVTGMNRCRYYFGTIETNSLGAAILVKPTAEMPALMSFLSFTGLQGCEQRGKPGYTSILPSRASAATGSKAPILWDSIPACTSAMLSQNVIPTGSGSAISGCATRVSKNSEKEWTTMCGM